jgi:predicted NUDIX family NTP pyrophosphohydrolase
MRIMSGHARRTEPKEPKVDKRGRVSAGLLVWRRRDGYLEVLIGHPGGPYFVRKDAGHWTVLKGEIEPGEEAVAVARREFAEETGQPAPDGPLVELGQIRQKSGKVVHAWAVEGEVDADACASNTFEMEWPPRSGRIESFPEIDRVAWFDLTQAHRMIKAAQAPFLDRLAAAAEAGAGGGDAGE